MAALYDRLFVVLGPAAVVFGAFFVAWGDWVGLVLVAIGVGMTWMGWRWLIRAVRSRG
jgi:hypothetical protein